MSGGELFKTGLLVADLERAMRDLSRWLGVAWRPVQQAPLTLETPGGREEVALRFSYTTSGPPFLELLEAQPRGYYALAQGEQIHHVGRWVGDLAAASAELARQGLAREAAGVGPDGAVPALFAFHRGAHGVRVELVDSAMRAGFEAWLGGGALSLPTG